MSHRPWPVCGNEACICADASRPACDEFMFYFNEYCIRCGWEAVDHQPKKRLIHNGRKP